MFTKVAMSSREDSKPTKSCDRLSVAMTNWFQCNSFQQINGLQIIAIEKGSPSSFRDELMALPLWSPLQIHP
jgi:hypothetical protein